MQSVLFFVRDQSWPDVLSQTAAKENKQSKKRRTVPAADTEATPISSYSEAGFGFGGGAGGRPFACTIAQCHSCAGNSGVFNGW